VTYAQFCNMGHVFVKTRQDDATLFAGGSAHSACFPGSALDDWLSYGVGRRRNFNTAVATILRSGQIALSPPGIQLGACISRGKRILFGVCANVLQVRRIGDDSVILAGAVVWNDAKF
jgi:hypothetical protein